MKRQAPTNTNVSPEIWDFAMSQWNAYLEWHARLAERGLTEEQADRYIELVEQLERAAEEMHPGDDDFVSANPSAQLDALSLIVRDMRAMLAPASVKSEVTSTALAEGKVQAVATLEGALLDVWVARAQGWKAEVVGTQCIVDGHHVYSPSTKWEEGGPIIENHYIDVFSVLGERPEDALTWNACFGFENVDVDGPTLLVAAMRAFVAMCYGDTVRWL